MNKSYDDDDNIIKRTICYLSSTVFKQTNDMFASEAAKAWETTQRKNFQQQQKTTNVSVENTKQQHNSLDEASAGIAGKSSGVHDNKEQPRTGCTSARST